MINIGAIWVLKGQWLTPIRKQILEDYAKQIQFLAQELQSVQKQFESTQKAS